MVEISESGKIADFHFVLCRTRLPRTARATNSCTPRWFGRRTARVLLADFWYFWSCKSTIKEKSLYDSIGSSRRRPLQTKTQVQPTAKTKDICPTRFFFCICRRKRKSYQKENAEIEISRSAERDEDSASSTSQAFKKA